MAVDYSDDGDTQEAMPANKLLLVETLLKCSNVINNIAQALKILLAKRATIEEKMITLYFGQLASSQAQILSQICRLILEPDSSHVLVAVKPVSELADSLNVTLTKFLKAATYDLNYLEQYFEHGFYDMLSGSKFLEESRASCETLATLAGELGERAPD
jgi:hypothetical protein